MGVTLDGFLRCASEDEAARVRAALPKHVQLTRAEPGCLRFEVEPTDDPLVWTVWAKATQGSARDYEIKGMP